MKILQAEQLCHQIKHNWLDKTTLLKKEKQDILNTYSGYFLTKEYSPMQLAAQVYTLRMLDLKKGSVQFPLLLVVKLSRQQILLLLG